MDKPTSNICWSRVQMEGSFPQPALSHTMGISHVCTLLPPLSQPFTIQNLRAILVSVTK